MYRNWIKNACQILAMFGYDWGSTLMSCTYIISPAASNISLAFRYMQDDNACLDLLLAFFMLFAPIHLGSTTTSTTIISSPINKKKMIRLLPASTQYHATMPGTEPRPRRLCRAIDAATARLTLEDHHNGQRGTRNIQIAGIKRGPGSWHKSRA